MNQYTNELALLLTEVPGNKNQIQNVDYTIAIGIWGGFAETVGNLD